MIWSQLFVVNWTIWNKLQWTLNRNVIFVEGNEFANIGWKMAAILFRVPCVHGYEIPVWYVWQEQLQWMAEIRLSIATKRHIIILWIVSGKTITTTQMTAHISRDWNLIAKYLGHNNTRIAFKYQGYKLPTWPPTKHIWINAKVKYDMQECITSASELEHPCILKRYQNIALCGHRSLISYSLRAYFFRTWRYWVMPCYK